MDHLILIHQSVVFLVLNLADQSMNCTATTESFHSRPSHQCGTESVQQQLSSATTATTTACVINLTSTPVTTTGSQLFSSTRVCANRLRPKAIKAWLSGAVFLPPFKASFSFKEVLLMSFSSTLKGQMRVLIYNLTPSQFTGMVQLHHVQLIFE